MVRRFRIVWPGLLAASAAFAQGDPFYLGTGRDGPLVVSDAGVIVNRYASVSGIQSVADSLPVDSSQGISAGTLVLVWQTQGAPFLDAGDPGPIVLQPGHAGHFELARVRSVGALQIDLETPLSVRFEPGAQVVTVPEHTAVTIAPGGRIEALPWNGLRGGIVAIVATGDVLNDGMISASHAGFRGGQWVLDTTNGFGCTAVDEPAARGAQRGEGTSRGRYGSTHTGRLNVGIGGGGAICRAAGGGGGANAGTGGKGGRTYSGDGSRDVGGFAGAPVVATLTRFLLPGGGGGAGEDSFTAAPRDTRGGHGGGVIFVRGDRLLGSGTISADGQTGNNGVVQGAGGGGAGGSISLRFAGQVVCTSVMARGGDGGSNASTADPNGPGGGGGGGRVLLQGADITGCPAVVLSGRAGLNGANPTGDPDYGASPPSHTLPSHVGIVEMLDASYLPEPTGSDGGSSDAGPDGGPTRDAGPGIDGGVAASRGLEVRCGCSASDALVALAAAIALALKRRNPLPFA